MSKLEKESEKAKARLEIDGVIVDCWSALILVSQGRCLGKPASFLLFQLPSLSKSWPNLATWTRFSTFFYLLPTFPLVFIPVEIPLLLSSFCRIIEASSHWASSFLSISFFKRVRLHAESSGLEKSSGRWVRAQPACGSEVSLQQDRGWARGASPELLSLFQTRSSTMGTIVPAAAHTDRLKGGFSARFQVSPLRC